MGLAVTQFEVMYLTARNQTLEFQRMILQSQLMRLTQMNTMYTMMLSGQQDAQSMQSRQIELYQKIISNAETRIQQMLSIIDTEHQSIKPRLEAARNVIKENIKSGFSTFS